MDKYYIQSKGDVYIDSVIRYRFQHLETCYHQGDEFVCDLLLGDNLLMIFVSNRFK